MSRASTVSPASENHSGCTQAESRDSKTSLHADVSLLRSNDHTAKRLPKFRSVACGLCRILFCEGLSFPSGREILRECGNLLWRIGKICETSPYGPGAHYGRFAGNREHRRENERTRRCILDTKGISQSHPKATMLDRQIFVMGWKLGAEWGLGESGTSHQDNAQKGHRASRTPSEAWGGNLTPPQAVPQSSKRDPSAPLP